MRKGRKSNRVLAVKLAKKAQGFIQLPGNAVHKDKKSYTRKNKHKKANHQKDGWLQFYLIHNSTTTQTIAVHTDPTLPNKAPWVTRWK